jgi:hypothetical protein
VSGVQRICLWSGPRNVSTAVMYAFRQRPDTTVVDEPLYAHYLATTGVEHPAVQDVISAQDTDGEHVVETVILGEAPTPVIFFKNMAHHLVGLDLDFLDRIDNVILTREPSEMLTSLINQVPNPTLDGTSLPMQVELVERIQASGKRPLVLDARRLLLDPSGVLRSLCDGLGLEWDDAMLSWPRGPKPEDGVWAPHWYHSVHRSTGFGPYRAKSAPVPDRLRKLLADALPLYDRLLEYAVGAG